LLRVEEQQRAFLARLDDPEKLLSAAMAAADRVGDAARAHGENLADLAAAEATEAALQAELDAWDQWFEDKLERLEQHRLETHGSREPAWAKGSGERARKRHAERTAGLRAELEDAQQAVAAAGKAAADSQAALQSAQRDFNDVLEAFRRALAALRDAKDRFAEVAIRHWRCSPCEALSKQWSSVARLQALINRLEAMLSQAIARTAAQMQQAQATAAAAAQRAADARGRVNDLNAERARIEQAMRDAVRMDDSGCLSFEPQEGWGWVNLATVDGARVTVVAQGAGLVKRTSFKGSEVRVYNKPGCLRERIENINWTKINELNNQLADIDAQTREAEAEAIEAERQSARAQAAVDGLQARLDALRALDDALKGSGLEQNTEDVLRALEKVSEDCAAKMKEAVDGIAAERKRKRDAQDRIAAGTGRRDGLRRRADRAGDDVDDIDPSPGESDDVDTHGRLKRRADDLEDAAGEPPPGIPEDTPGSDAVPDSLEEAERQRKAAKDAADAAEDAADTLDDENDALEDEIEDLEDDIGELEDRIREWRDYRAALARYEDCLREKQKAAEELAEINTANASALQELADLLGEAADGLSEVADGLDDAGKVDKRAKKASKKAADLSDKLSRVGRAMEILDAVLRSDELKPSEKLEAMSKAFEELREWLPHLPGVSEMLEFYNEAMKAIAGALGEIEDRLSEQWADLVDAGIADPEDAPIGIREEVRKLAKIKKLMRILARNCGERPMPPD
jgi:chromosome segregation ATPase